MSNNKKITHAVFILVAAATFSYFTSLNAGHVSNAVEDFSNFSSQDEMRKQEESQVIRIATKASEEKTEKGAPSSRKNEKLVPPMDRGAERITKKTFGMFITPESSPVKPDKFRGFHTGIDWEVFPEELEKDIPVRTICSGDLLLKKNASGYGGVAVQECELENETITVIYGHLSLDSIKRDQGDKMEAGEILGVLGKHFSVQTDGARKHLHLAIHNGKRIELKGYIGSSASLSEWIDPCLYVCGTY